MKLTFILVCSFLPLQFAFSQHDSPAKDPTTAMENFDFKAINYTNLDSTSCNYIQAIEHSLYHRFDQAETLMKKVALQSTSELSGAARYYLLNDLYFWRGRYPDYVQFADQVNEKPAMYKLAKSLVSIPVSEIVFSRDSVVIPVTIRKHSYIIADVLLNGKPARLILDTGAGSSIISQRLSTQLRLKNLANLDFLNSVGTTFNGSMSLLDSLSIGDITVKNTLITSAGKSKFFKRLHVDGLLGWDVLRKFSYTADFKAQTLTIRKPVVDSTVEKNLFGIGSPIMVVRTIAGTQLNMYFDSGSNNVDLTANGAAKLGSYSTMKRPGLIAGIGKVKIGLFRYVKQFTFQANHHYQLSRKYTYVTPINRFILSIRRDGILSNVPFQKGRLTIDYLNNHFDYRE